VNLLNILHLLLKLEEVLKERRRQLLRVANLLQRKLHPNQLKLKLMLIKFLNILPANLLAKKILLRSQEKYQLKLQSQRANKLLLYHLQEEKHPLRQLIK
jgi:hypothetical protein